MRESRESRSDAVQAEGGQPDDPVSPAEVDRAPKDDVGVAEEGDDEEERRAGGRREVEPACRAPGRAEAGVVADGEGDLDDENDGGDCEARERASALARGEEEAREGAHGCPRRRGRRRSVVPT